MDTLARFAELLARPPQDVALDEASLCVAAVGQPEVDVDHQLGRLDALAAECRASSVEELVRFLFASGRFAGNADDYYDPRNSFLDQVLARGLGIPISLSVLGIEIGRRLGLPLVGVGMPGHFLVRDHTDDDLFVDVFNGGRVLGASDCEALFRRTMGRQAPWQHAYLQPVTPVAIIERIVANLRLTFQRTGDLRNLQWVLRLRVRCPSATDADRDELARLLAHLN